MNIINLRAGLAPNLSSQQAPHRRSRLFGLYPADTGCSQSVNHLGWCRAEWIMFTAQLRMAGRSIRESMATSRLAMGRRVPTVPLTPSSPRQAFLVVSKIQQVTVPRHCLFRLQRCIADVSAAYAAPATFCDELLCSSD